MFRNAVQVTFFRKKRVNSSNSRLEYTFDSEVREEVKNERQKYSQMNEMQLTRVENQHWFASITAMRLFFVLGTVAALPLVSSFSMDPNLLVGGSAGVKRTSLVLHAKPPNSRSSSSTARDSAIHVEWEPIPELQRRIEDGIHYEHWNDDYETRGTNGAAEVFDGGAEEEPAVQVEGVFFGYRVTPEERARLRSADPSEPEAYDI